MAKKIRAIPRAAIDPRPGDELSMHRSLKMRRVVAFEVGLVRYKLFDWEGDLMEECVVEIGKWTEWARHAEVLKEGEPWQST